MLNDNLLLYGPQIVMYYLYVYDAVESGIKQLNWIELNSKQDIPRRKSNPEMTQTWLVNL